MRENRIFWLDFVRAIAIICVITIHTSAPYLYSNSANWLVANFFDSLSRVGVPLFIMVSGALLITENQTPLLSFYKKRFLRIIWPWFFWGIIFVIIKIVLGGQIIGPRSAFIQIFNGTVFYHFWFMALIASLYFVTPLVNRIIPFINRQILWYFIVLWLAVTSLFLFVIKPTNLTTGFPLALGYLGYFILGYRLKEVDVVKITGLLIITLYIIATAVTFLGTTYLQIPSGQFNEILYAYLSPNVIVASLALFLIIKRFGHTFSQKLSDRPLNLFTAVSQSSFGIYFVHVLILGFLFQGLFIPPVFPVSLHPLVAIPLIVISVVVISLIVILPLQKIPLIRHVVT